MCTNLETLRKFESEPSNKAPGTIYFEGNTTRLSVKCLENKPFTCEIDADCPEKYFKGGCCAMVDPGKVPTDTDVWKSLGNVNTKSKMCKDADFKTLLADLKKAGQDFLTMPDTTEKWYAYCDGTAVPPFSCTTDSNCDAE